MAVVVALAAAYVGVTRFTTHGTWIRDREAQIGEAGWRLALERLGGPLIPEAGTGTGTGIRTRTAAWSALQYEPGGDERAHVAEELVAGDAARVRVCV